jgi:hypothetical protein
MPICFIDVTSAALTLDNVHTLLHLLESLASLVFVGVPGSLFFSFGNGFDIETVSKALAFL